jgi:hypothetical protein
MPTERRGDEGNVLTPLWFRYQMTSWRAMPDRDRKTGKNPLDMVKVYGVEADAFLCDVFTLEGKLIGHALPIRASIIENCFRKRG